MKIEMRATGSVRPYEHNPRLNDAAVDAVARSLGEFGFRQPIVVDADGVIIVGHTRWRAARQLGMAEVPVHVADLDPVRARAYRIADNQTATIAEWDMDLLPAELRDLENAEFDLSILGWSQEDLDAMLADAGAGGGAAEDADEVPEPPKVALTRPGDLWVLGRHRLLCGDSTKPADVDRLLDGERAALCATDPPYLVDYTGERPDDSGKDWSGTYREVEITDAESFFTGVFTNVLRVIAPHAAIYTWHAHKRQRLIAEVWEELGILDHQQIVWVKPTPVFGRVFWHFRHEPCMMGWRQGSMPDRARAVFARLAALGIRVPPASRFDEHLSVAETMTSASATARSPTGSSTCTTSSGWRSWARRTRWTRWRICGRCAPTATGSRTCGARR